MELVGEGTYGKVFKAHIKRKKTLSEVITPVKSEGNNQEALQESKDNREPK